MKLLRGRNAATQPKPYAQVDSLRFFRCVVLSATSRCGQLAALVSPLILLRKKSLRKSLRFSLNHGQGIRAQRAQRDWGYLLKIPQSLRRSLPQPLRQEKEKSDA
jgi:hypothetical protein